MVKFLSLFLIVFLVGVRECNSVDECEESKAPEINFKFLLGGEIMILDAIGAADITAQFSSLNMIMNKAYCDGLINGPFDQNYAITTDGSLVRQSIGTWSFRMDNKKDYMNVNLFCRGHELGVYNIYYDELKSDDEGTAYFAFEINAIWNSEKEDFSSVVIKVKP